MTALKRFFAALGAYLRRIGKAVRTQPLGVVAAVCGLIAAILAVGLPWRLAPILNNLNLAVAKRLAGTGNAALEPILTASLDLLWRAALTAVLYLAAVRCAMRCARKLQRDLRAAVDARCKAHAAEGHTPPPDWERDVARDIDRIAAMTSAAPEWLMLLAGIVFCVTLLLRAPFSLAVIVPLTGIALCAARDLMRRRGGSRVLQLLVPVSLWCLGAFLLALRASRMAEPAVPPGTLAALLLGMALLVPAALQLPYRNLGSAWQAFRRVHGFLK